MLTVTLLVCSMIALARANNNSTDEDPFDDFDADSWNDFNGRNYFFVPTNLTWAEAEKNCRSMKANLASVHNMDEYQFIHDLVKLVTLSNPRTWIGGTDCQQNNIWLWSDGSDFTFSMWSQGQPDNLHGQQACIQINHGVSNQWDDTNCSNQRPSICVKPL